ncbi:hypothetical protein ABT168_13140 [Streptomyces sp. NPDC001793]|uniref:hypothetical protein n=1 Tax=Streptomyces sp. NPDC001793 TaxID=3154657 RepID=UPI00332E0F6D
MNINTGEWVGTLRYGLLASATPVVPSLIQVIQVIRLGVVCPVSSLLTSEFRRVCDRVAGDRV